MRVGMDLSPRILAASGMPSTSALARMWTDSPSATTVLMSSPALRCFTICMRLRIGGSDCTGVAAGDSLF